MDNRSVPPRIRFWGGLCYVSVLILLPACVQAHKDDFVKFHLNQGLVLLALATVCGAISQLPYCGKLGLTLTLLADALSLVGLVHVLRGYKTPLPLVSRITKNSHPFG